ncbi:MAG: hypothetical protein IJK60_01240 [Clostridia bacterium]|nr:hypothetical protein [Clostridia bacterium]
MIDCWKTADAYRRNYGAPAVENGEFAALCRAACDEISPLVREGADPDDIRLLNLAAATARCVLTEREAAHEGSAVSFRAGDVAVSTDFAAVIKRAQEDRKRRFESALPLLKDSGFCFTQVKI